MKRLIQTKFFCTLQEASRKGIEADAGVLRDGYDEFAMRLFSQCAARGIYCAYATEGNAVKQA